nr:hypothetical protein [Reticulibacter mediterranei]
MSREGKRFASQPLHVPYGRDVKETLIFAIEVGGVLVSDTIGHPRGIEVFLEHETTRLQEAQLLLEL